jgi:hypothetical protein
LAVQVTTSQLGALEQLAAVLQQPEMPTLPEKMQVFALQAAVWHWLTAQFAAVLQQLAPPDEV